ncbi:hypothetical protein GIB67_031673, partial [Kingdonia uniflora]
KINCNGSSLESPGASGLGAVFRSHSGTVLGVLVENLGVCTSYFAECCSIVSALSTALQHGWMKVFLVSVSNAAITAFQ